MKKGIYQIIISLILLISCEEKDNYLYHEIERTSSSFNIVKWKINKNNLPDFYIKEKFDNDGRVIELMFFENGEVKFNEHCYTSGWIKFEYPNDSTILQLNLNEKGHPEGDLECELPSKTIYHISNDKKKILKVDFEYEINEEIYLKNGISMDELNRLKLQLKEYDKDKKIGFVDAYSMSFKKLNGVFPTSNDFNLSDYFFSPKEKTEIMNIVD